MKKGLFLLICIVTSVVSGFSQSIPSYWMNIYKLNDLYRINNGNVEQISAKATIYYASGSTYKQKWTFKFVDSNKIVGVLFKDSKLTSSFEYVLNDTGTLVRKKITAKQPLIGWQTKIVEYEYDEGDNLIFEKYYNKDMKLMEYVRFDYNTSNKPIKMTVFNSSDEIISYETADYDIQKNTYTYRVFNVNGNLVSEEIMNLNYDTSYDNYNEHGDLELFRWPSSAPDENITHKLEYKYDDNGNWVKRKWVIINGKKKKNKSKVKREISYLE